MGQILDGYPWWSQLTDPDPRTGRPDVFASTDCGEEVVSIWTAGKTGKYTDAADLRRALPGPRVDGVTSGGDLVYLLSLAGILAEAGVLPVRSLKAAVHEDIGEGQPLAVLGRWVSPVVLHWILGVGFGNDAFVAMEPWSGRMAAYRWSVVSSLAIGTVVQHKAC